MAAQLPHQTNQPWHPLPNQSIWFAAKTFYNLVDYWERYATPERWEIRAAYYDSTGAFIQEEPMEWGHLLESRPKLWIDELVTDSRLRTMIQPIVDARVEPNPRLIGYEVLIRGLDGGGQIISPAELFGGARDQDRLFLLDRACRVAAIETIPSLPDESSLVFINFVPTSIYVPEHCLQTTLAAVERNHVDPGRIVFEVVETERVDDLAHLLRILHFYRKKGFRYALDDVGAGQHTVDTIYALEPNVVKLDREWSSGIASTPAKQSTAEAVLRACERVGAIALAEGIENAEDAKLLSLMGFHWQQGYFYGRPSWSPLSLSQVGHPI